MDPYLCKTRFQLGFNIVLVYQRSDIVENDFSIPIHSRKFVFFRVSGAYHSKDARIKTIRFFFNFTYAPQCRFR